MVTLTVHVKEVGMVAPDIVCMIIHDQDPEIGHLLQLSTPDSAAMDAVVQRDPVTGGAGTAWCQVTGQLNGVQKMFLKFADKKPTAYLDRVAVRNLANWSTIGGRTVTNVYHKCRSFGQVTAYSPGMYRSTTMQHYIYLKLSGNLAQGTHNISITGNTFPAYSFAEKVKTALVSMWIPGYGTEGRMDYSSFTTAELIDSRGATVFTAPLTLLRAATTIDPDDSFGASNYDYASSTIPPRVASAVVTGAGFTTITVAGAPHGFTTGHRKFLQNFGASTGGAATGLDGERVIDVTGANTFTVPLVGSAWVPNSYRTGYDSLIFDTWSGNRWGTNLYVFDFSAFDAVNYQGNYRVRIAGLGVSDVFALTESARYDQAKVHMQGYYNQLQGMDLDPAVGLWDRKASFRDGTNGVQIYESRCPGSLNSEAFSDTPEIMSGFGCCSSISFDADLVSGNVFNVTVNGVAIAPVTFTTSHANTLNLITAAVKVALPGVYGIIHPNMLKSVCFYHTIGNGSSPSAPLVTFTGQTLTGGATQANIRLSPFLTTNRVTHPFVSIRDAGDWDFHECWVGAQNEGVIPYYLVEWAYRHLPAGKRDVSFGFPKASALNPTFYAGTDGLGDPVHMAIYQIDSFRATQKPDGRVYGGMNYLMIGVNGDKGGGFDFFAPSQYSLNNAALLAASPTDNFVYAAGAAKVAQVLLEAVPPFTTAGNAWKASAELAWDWAESMYQGWHAGGRTNSTIDGYFNGVLGLQSIGVTKSGLFMSDNTVWNNQLTSMFGAQHDACRYMAAGALYNLTDNNTKYGVVIAPRYTSGGAPNQEGMGLWDFVQCADAQTRYPTQVAYLNARWTDAVNKNSNFDMLIKPAIKGAQTQDNQYYKWMLEKLNYSHGVNQEDRTAVSALGYRSPQNCSIRDREAMGLTSDSVPGTRMYWHFAGQHAYGGSNSYSSDSILNFSVVAPMTGASADPMWETKVITPFPVMHPYEECFNDNTYAAFHTEYIAVYSTEFFNLSMIAHCFDGNDVTTTPDTSKRYKRRLFCAP